MKTQLPTTGDIRRVLEDGGLERITSRLPPYALSSAHELLAYLAGDTDALNAVVEWRWMVRAAAYGAGGLDELPCDGQRAP